MAHVTMQTIAEKLNISINAVSLALNGKEGVSHALRIQILKTAIDLDYPFKKLTTKKTLKNKTLLVMIEDKKQKDTYYYLDALHRLQKEAAIFGYRILCEFYNLEQFEVPMCICEQKVAGVMILGKHTHAMLTQLKTHLVSLLCLNHALSEMMVDAIIVNDFLGGYCSCEHLIACGCQRIGFVGDIHISENFQKRFNGYQRCLQTYFPNQNYEGSLITDVDQDIIRNDYQAIQKKLMALPIKPDGIICANDRIAAIVMKAIQYAGYKVPEDIQIIGFDNMQLSPSTTPSLTTFEVNRYQIAKRAIRRIHEMIHEETFPETIVLAPQIIKRQSTKKDPKKL